MNAAIVSEVQLSENIATLYLGAKLLKWIRGLDNNSTLPFKFGQGSRPLILPGVCSFDHDCLLFEDISASFSLHTSQMECREQLGRQATCRNTPLQTELCFHREAQK